VYLVFIFVTELLFELAYFLLVGFYGTTNPFTLVHRFDEAIYNGRRTFTFKVEYFKTRNANFTIVHYTTMDIAFGVSQLVLEFVWLLDLYFVSLFFYGVLPFTFWFAAKEFYVFIQNISGFHDDKAARMSLCEVILKKYEELKCLCDSINFVWSTTTFLWLIEISLRLIFVLNENLSRKRIFVVFAAMNCTFLGISLVIFAEGDRIVSNETASTLCYHFIKNLFCLNTLCF